MRKLIANFGILAVSLCFANPPVDSEAPISHTGQVSESHQRFLDQEKAIFEGGMYVRSFDVEEDHVWAAKRYVEALTSPTMSEEDFIAVMWINGQQMTALQRQNKIYLRNKEAPKWASYVFEKDIESRFKTFCASNADPKACVANLKEKALKVTEIFWTQFKKDAETDFKKNGLDKNRIGFHQMRGHMREAFRDPESPAWKAINEYTAALRAANPTALNPSSDTAPIPAKAIPVIPKVVSQPVEKVSHGRPSLKETINNAKKKLSKTLGLDPKIEAVPEEVKPWNYVDSTSKNYDLLRASSRYSSQVVRSLGCGYFEEASLLNGQIIARLLRQGSMDVAQLTQATNRNLESWCYSQFSTAAKINECKSKLGPLLAQLNKYYWLEIKKELEATKRTPTSQDVDNFFANLKTSRAISNPDHPLGAIHTSIKDTLQNIKDDWGYTCQSVKDEALGDYRILKATQEQKILADNLLQHLTKNPLRSPPGYCARSVKTGMDAAGLFKTYPGWSPAKTLKDRFEAENLNHTYLKEGYELQRLDTIDPDEAPAYAVIVYGGRGDGHVEVKIPTAELLSRGINTMKAYGKKDINVADRDFAYVSDYIDSAPRSSPKSRIARGDGSDNGRPVIGIYVIMRKS